MTEVSGRVEDCHTVETLNNDSEDPLQDSALTCTTDEELRTFLEAIEEARGFMENPACKGFTDSLKSLSDRGTPHRIGPYRILMKLGEGGMGIVYLAKQEKPVKRRVALKILKTGLASGQALARFSSELQALAYMSHPYIDTVFDSGITDEGYPYFTTAYLEGLPITVFCRHYEISLEDRLILFEKVCEGVQHAHRRGIIHRDLKPSNIIVIRRGDQLIPKIIDFGICKPLSGESLTDLTLFTQQGMFVGTPAYMSPEQIDGDIADLDTRSDCYALGVVLYELLCGALPHDPKELGVSFSKLLQIITVSDPPLASVKLSALFENGKITDTGMGISVQSLTRLLRCDLDQVLAKALAKDRTQRYGTPTEIAEDLNRYRHHLSVSAVRPSTTKRVLKFYRRNRIPVISLLAGVLSLMLGVVLLSFGYVNAVEAREAEQRARLEVERREQELKNSDEVFFALLSGPNPYKGTKDIKVRELLDKVAANLDHLDKEPLVRAHYQLLLGLAFYKLRELEKAEPHLEAAAETRALILGSCQKETRQAFNALGKLYLVMERPRSAFGVANSVLEACGEVEDGFDPEIIETRRQLAVSYRKLDEFESSLYQFDHLLDHLDRCGSCEETTTAKVFEGRGIVYYELEDYDNAERDFKKALALLEESDIATDPQIFRVWKHMSDVLQKKGKYEEAEALLSTTVRVHETYLGASHPTSLRSKSAYAKLLVYRGNAEDAIPILQEVLALRKEHVGSHDNGTIKAATSLAWALTEAGRHREAEPLLENVLSTLSSSEGPSDPKTIGVRTNLADCLAALDEYGPAEALLRENMAYLTAAGLLESNRAQDVRCTLGEVYTRQGLLDDAMDQFRELMAIAESCSDPDDLWLALYRLEYSRCLLALGRYPEANEQLLYAHEVFESSRSGFITDSEKAFDKLISQYDNANPARKW